MVFEKEIERVLAALAVLYADLSTVNVRLKSAPQNSFDENESSRPAIMSDNFHAPGLYPGGPIHHSTDAGILVLIRIARRQTHHRSQERPYLLGGEHGDVIVGHR